MDANTNITFEQMPQALAEVLSQVRLIKEAVMNGDNSRSSGRNSHVLVDIERACEITCGLGHFDDRVKVLLGLQVIAFPDLGAYDIWRKKAKDYPLLDITVSDYLEKNATQQQRDMAPIWRTGWWRKGWRKGLKRFWRILHEHYQKQHRKYSIIVAECALYFSKRCIITSGVIFVLL